MYTLMSHTCSKFLFLEQIMAANSLKRPNYVVEKDYKNFTISEDVSINKFLQLLQKTALFVLLCKIIEMVSWSIFYKILLLSWIEVARLSAE